MDDYIKNSKFVVIFHGDGKNSRLVDGFDAAIQAVKAGIWFEEPRQPEWDETVERITDPENWDTDEFGPWFYRERYEDGSMEIVRISVK